MGTPARKAIKIAASEHGAISYPSQASDGHEAARTWRASKGRGRRIAFRHFAARGTLLAHTHTFLGHITLWMARRTRGASLSHWRAYYTFPTTPY